MKNISSLFFLLMLLVVSVLGQSGGKTSVCTNEMVEKISSRGIKIGSKLDDVINLLASTEEEKQRIRNVSSANYKKSLGYAFFGVSPNQNPNQINERFGGISDYTFNFLDNGLTGFSVSYNKPKWRDTKQFVAKMAEILGLPDVENWNIDSDGRSEIQCGNYLLYAKTDNQIDRSSFGIRDNRIPQILEQRKQKAEDEQREKDLKTFKP
jgi:hypothetical protein